MLFVAGLTFGAFANNENPSVEIRQTEASKFVVSVPTAPQGKVIVRILDEENRLILRDQITTSEAFAKKYNLTALPVGTYSVEVSDAKGTLRTAKVSTEIKKSSPVYAQATQLAKNKYRLVVSSLATTDVQVQIFDGDQLIHAENVDHPQGLHKIYSIKNSRFSEAISFKLITNNNQVTYAPIR